MGSICTPVKKLLSAFLFFSGFSLFFNTKLEFCQCNFRNKAIFSSNSIKLVFKVKHALHIKNGNICIN